MTLAVETGYFCKTSEKKQKNIGDDVFFFPLKLTDVSSLMCESTFIVHDRDDRWRDVLTAKSIVSRKRVRLRPQEVKTFFFYTSNVKVYYKLYSCGLRWFAVAFIRWCLYLVWKILFFIFCSPSKSVTYHNAMRIRIYCCCCYNYCNTNTRIRDNLS